MNGRMLARMWWIWPSRGEEERLVDVGANPAAGQRRFGEEVELGPHLVAGDGELRRRRRCDDPVLRAAIEAAAQVISRESRLQADLDAGAVRRERHVVGPVAGQRVDVGLCGRDALGLGDVRGAVTRSAR